MGIRITVFAVDAEIFAGILCQPLWKVLAELMRLPTDTLFEVRIPPGSAPPTCNTRYQVRPGHILRRAWASGHKGQMKAILTELADSALQAEEPLKEPLGEYLARTSSLELDFFLSSSSDMAGNPCVREVVSEYKRWWVGSILKAADRVWRHTPMFQELAILLARMLRGFDCGWTLKQFDAERHITSFPCLPANDEDHRMATFEPTETTRLVELLDLLMQCQPDFRDPAGQSGDYAEIVHSIIDQFIKIPTLPLEKPYLVSFIG